MRDKRKERSKKDIGLPTYSEQSLPNGKVT